MEETLAGLLQQRFGTDVPVPPELARLDELVQVAAHRSYRSFKPEPIPTGWLQTLLACALSAPSKSDLQQSCIIRIEDAGQRNAITELVPGLPWLPSAPVLLMFCGDGRRIRRICGLRGRPFGNDHLDAMFNPAVDAALVMMNFIRVAEAVGLGCCPLSMVRNRAAEVSEVLALPPLVFPVAGMAAGFPDAPVDISARLPLSLSVHMDRYDDSNLASDVDSYDSRRNARRPFAREKQRYPEQFGYQDNYGWSEDKARQVSKTERGEFGRYLRDQGFRLD